MSFVGATLRIVFDFGGVLFVLRVRLNHEFTHLVLGLRVVNRPKQREVGRVAVDVEWACGEGHGVPSALATTPDGEAD